MTTRVVVGEELHRCVRELSSDPRAVVGLADETGLLPAAWRTGSGRGSSRIREAVTERLGQLTDSDRGFLNEDSTPVLLTVRVGSNTTLPPILTRYLPADQR